MIKTYHAHIYFTLAQTTLAEKVRQNIIDAIPTLTYQGKLIPKCVGPHPKPMFEIHIPANGLEASLAVIDAKRAGLDVLIHPVHDDHLQAHTTDAKWLGQPQTLNVEVFDNL